MLTRPTNKGARLPLGSNWNPQLRAKQTATEVGASLSGLLALIDPRGLGGQVRIGQAAIQHFTKVIWVVSKDLKREHPYVALASAGLS